MLAYRGEPYSAAYVQGISGAAFHVGGICPCAPTCTPGIDPADLVRLFGYAAEQIEIPQKGPEQDAPLARLIARVKDEIRAGRPALVWNAFTTAEWDVVCGFDARPAEVASLKEAIRHARSERNREKLGGEGWVFLDGLLCYERWARDFRTKPDKKRDAGDAYCYGIFRSTHRAASGCLRELAPRYPAASGHLQAAAGHFAAEADILDSGESLLWWNSPEGPDVARNARAADLLDRACALYRQGVEEIEKAVAAV